eukprot:CAMPEP_0115830284 /NCGR_PEP_ID=MMETSP0287-20121206/1539_1 /TAXON_ID=412157 /ORGANISM="Chrysochromulina rotalis, Strain UIO044" /LENGTH=159 /DNA_ID=CAMNT_0003283585 /DNA_START=466 /DNA_END=944 /DNA_ORIENTATION=-
MSAPLFVARPPSSSRALTASGHGACGTCTRTSHLVLSLLTFCPPDPDARAYVNDTQSSAPSSSTVGGKPSTRDGVQNRIAAGASPPCWTSLQLSEILPSETLDDTHAHTVANREHIARTLDTPATWLDVRYVEKAITPSLALKCAERSICLDGFDHTRV